MGHPGSFSWKDPRAVDTKILRQYNIDISKWSKWRAYHQSGEAKLQYLRYDRFFVILASDGSHHFLRREANCVRDARRVSIKFAGYSVSFRGGHACVRIEVGREKSLKADLLKRALEPREALEARVYNLPFEPYKPIRQQLLTIIREVNRVRAGAGLEALSDMCIRYRRKIVRPFEAEGEGMEEAA